MFVLLDSESEKDVDALKRFKRTDFKMVLALGSEHGEKLKNGVYLFQEKVE